MGKGEFSIWQAMFLDCQKRFRKQCLCVHTDQLAMLVRVNPKTPQPPQK